MVAHRINITGGVLGGTHEQKIEGNQTLHCRSVILKTVCVQLKTIASEMTQKDGMKTGKTLPPVPTKGCVGISLRFPTEMVPSSATTHAGSENERSSNHRIDVHFSQDTKTFIYHPNVIMRNVVFQTEYQIDMFYLDSLNTSLDKVTMDDIHSITLNFECDVTNLMPI
jgi:hypothetical protein